jgi:hypothetical protein
LSPDRRPALASTTLALPALAVLALCTAYARTTHTGAGQYRPDHGRLIDLTVNEIRRLINTMINQLQQ